MTTPTLLDKFTELFTWVVARMGDLVTFITSNDVTVYYLAILFIGLSAGLLFRFFKHRA